MTSSTADDAHSPAAAARAPRTSRRAPRRQPPAVLLTWGVLLALTTAALLDVLPLTDAARLLVTFSVLAVVIALAAWSQLHYRGTLNAPSFAPSRYAVAIVGVSMTLLLAFFPESIGLPVRVGLVLLAPALMVALLAWDDADTVATLRKQREAQPHGAGTAPGRA